MAAACEALAERIAALGAHLLQAERDQVTLRDGGVQGPSGHVPLEDVARLWYLQPENLPEDADPRGLEVMEGYRTVVDSGTFSYAAHACVVAVDPETGETELLDYAVVEDGGVLINPMIVDGQVYGGIAQGIGTALYEEMPYDESAQPLASTLADYHLPGASEIPSMRIEHMETPSPYTRFGQKGIGEGRRESGPPAAIANAINDALGTLGVEVDSTPITLRKVLAKIIASHDAAAGLLKSARVDRAQSRLRGCPLDIPGDRVRGNRRAARARDGREPPAPGRSRESRSPSATPAPGTRAHAVDLLAAAQGVRESHCGADSRSDRC